MILNNCTYEEVLNLIINGHSYRYISDTFGISTTTVFNTSKRFKKTGSPYPSLNQRPIYDPMIQEVQNFINEALCMRRASHNIHKRKNLTQKEIHLLVLAKGYNLSFLKTKELIRYGKNMLAESHLTLFHAPGEAVEFDWGTIYLHINDPVKATRIALAIFSFPYSNYKKAYAMKDCSGQSFSIAFNQFVNDVGGIPPKLILDNMRIARIFSKSNRSDQKLTALFLELSDHFKFDVRFCSPYCPNQKGNVENNVGILKKHFDDSHVSSFASLAEVQEFIDHQMIKSNSKQHHRKHDRVENLFKHEKCCFLPKPDKDFIYYDTKFCRVSSKAIVQFKKQRYLVPEIFRKERVLVKYNSQHVLIFSEDGKQFIAKYVRTNNNSSQEHLRIWYILNRLRSKSNGILDSLEYRSFTKDQKLIMEKIFKNDGADFIDFIMTIKNRKRNLLKKFVYRFKNHLEQFTPQTIRSYFQIE